MFRELEAGQAFAGYRIESEIGRGASGVVYLARDANDEPVAIKVPIPLLQEDPGAAERFARAAISAGRLRHRNVVPVLDAGLSEGLPYVAMERVPGPSLERVLLAQRTLADDVAARIVEDVANAVTAAHQIGMVHGGLNPRRILFDASRELDVDEPAAQPGIRVEGFGERDAAGRRTIAGAGSAAYLAPEQLQGAPATPASDVYSLGALLYRIYSGDPPGLGGEAARGPLEPIIRSTMAIDPDQRLSAPEVADALRAVVSGGGGSTVHAGGSGSSGGGSEGDDGNGDYGNGDDGDGDDGPPRSMYARLETPEVVYVGEEFKVVAGVAPEAQEGVLADEMVVPDTVEGDYDLDVEVVAVGFKLADGESWARRLHVSGGSPYPWFPIHLTPEPQSESESAQSISATYTIAGHTVGIARRPLWVARDRGVQPSEPPEAPAASDVARPAHDVPPADLTVNIIKAGPGDGVLKWTLASPHEVDLPTGLPPVDIGSAPRDYAKNLVAELSNLDGKASLYFNLLGKGQAIAQHVPQRFWEALEGVAAAVEGKPTVLLASEEPYVPWELAVMPAPLDPGLEPYLAVQTAVARWIPTPIPPPKSPPPSEATATAMAVVTGDYSETSLDDLEAAHEEATELENRYHAQKVDALELEVLQCLAEGDPDVDLLHFAMHGKWNANGYADGLVMSDKQVMGPDTIRGAGLRRPTFVFLNVCQVGATSEVLGSYSGVAVAFLAAGAEGVVAPLWSIRDTDAKRLALAFYERVFDEESPVGPAEALRAAREEFVKDMEDPTATTMALRFFGHPNLSFTGRPEP